MREYGQVQCSLWSHPDYLSRSDQGKLLCNYLLTGPHSNGLGCYRLPFGYIEADLQWDRETVSKAFTELDQIGFAQYDHKTQFVFLPKFLKFNKISNANVAKSRRTEFRSIPTHVAFYAELARSILTYGNHLPKDFEKSLQTLLQGSLEGFDEGLGKQDPTRTDPKETEPKGGAADASPPPPGNENNPSREMTIDTFIAECKRLGEKAIPEDDPVFTYAEEVQLPIEFVRLAWREFVVRYRDRRKRQKGLRGWRQTFRTCVRANWYRLWYADPSGAFVLTTTGVQAQRVHQERKEVANA